MDKDFRFAVLIDAENISYRYIKKILEEIPTNATATYRRAYADWTKPSLSSWKPALLDNSFTPIQQYSYTTGKSSSDSAMIIDAMDILYSGQVGGFCLVASDSDYTRLAARLRESGAIVIGMGETKTPKPFINACNQFKYLDLLSSSDDIVDGETASNIQQSDQVQANLTDTLKLLKGIIDEVSDDDGWSSLSEVGLIISKRLPDFDVRNFGFKKLNHFIANYKRFELKYKAAEGGRSKHYYVKNK